MQVILCLKSTVCTNIATSAAAALKGLFSDRADFPLHRQPCNTCLCSLYHLVYFKQQSIIVYNFTSPTYLQLAWSVFSPFSFLSKKPSVWSEHLACRKYVTQYHNVNMYVTTSSCFLKLVAPFLLANKVITEEVIMLSLIHAERSQCGQNN